MRRSRRDWTPGEDKRLRALFKEGRPRPWIALNMGRQLSVVRVRLIFLKMIEPAYRQPPRAGGAEAAFAAAMKGRFYDIRATPDAGGPRLPRIMTVVESACSMDFL